MKTKFSLFYTIFFVAFSFAQETESKLNLLKDKCQTKILYDRVYGLSDATNLQGKTITADLYKQVYSEIQRADFEQRLPDYSYIKEQALLGFAENVVPLSILITDFESIKKGTTDELQRNHIQIMAPLVSKFKGKTVTFILKDNLVFNTKVASIIKNIEADFNDGLGFRKIEINKPIHVEYQNIGTYKIDFKIKFNLDCYATYKSTSTINIQEPEYPANANRSTTALVPNVVTPIAATITFQGQGETAGYLGQGQYKYFPDTTNGIFDKPIILLDGFDPGDARSCDVIYNLLNYGTGQNLATDLRAQGFDVIILNFPTYTRTGTTTVVDGGVDFIERNAMILVELLNQVNADKVGTQKNVVIGPSMGGLISRYALRYMEQHAPLNHDTRLYISFDSPHYGANVPIGMQHLLNYMAYGPMAATAVQPIVDGMLKSPAAREMLIDHLEGHLQSGSAFAWQTATASLLPTGCPNYRTAFQNTLNTMGFPTTTRNVSIANGAGNGTMTGTPGMSVMNHIFVNPTNSNQRAIIQLHFTPTTNTNLEVSNFQGQQWVLWWITGYSSTANSKSPTYTSGLDSAPGGRFDMSQLTAGATDPTLIEFANSLLINYFDFIPTWSSMAISGTQNLYSSFPGTGLTSPFAAWSIPTVNENHVTLNAQNTAFAIAEIVNPTLATNNPNFDSIFVQNPISNSIEIFSPNAINEAIITLTDISGKTIISKENQTIEGNYQLPIAVSKGIYLLTIKNNEASVVKKIVRE